MTIASSARLTLGLLASTALATPGAGPDDAAADDRPVAGARHQRDRRDGAAAARSSRRRTGNVPDQTEIIITATKREENLQNVPISVQAIGTRRLDQLNISNFEEYTKQLPSVSASRRPQPGVTTVYMRGVATRRRRQPLGLAAVGRHLPRRAAGHDDRRNARRPHLRHRPDREPRRARRARSTAHRAKRARSASSPTSPSWA